MKISSNLNTPINILQNGQPQVKPYSERSNNPSFGLKIDDSGKIAKFINWSDEGFNSAWQRLASGATAIVTQPFFDLSNDRVDEETRIGACSRTIGKIIAGTLTGVGIRALCIKVAENFTRNKNTEKHLIEIGKGQKAKTEFSKWDRLLLNEDAFKNATYSQIRKYRGAIGTFAALGVMIGTNFLIDAPLTTYLTNKIYPVLSSRLKKTEKIESKGGNA